MQTRELVDLELVTDGLDFPEGPISMPDGSVLVVEVRGGTLTRVEPDGSKSVVADLGGGPNGAAIGPDGAVYICNNGGINPKTRGVGCIQRVDLQTGQSTTLYTTSDGAPFIAPNDLVFDDTGNFWFTDMRGHTIHYASPGGSSIRTVLKYLHTPNGIGLAPDGSVLYWAQTQTRQVLRRHIEQPGVLIPSAGHDTTAVMRSGGVDPFALLIGLPGATELDSLAIDSSGAVCVGALVNGGVVEIPADGDPDGVVHWTLPDRLADNMVTNICFGGPDLTTAYLTCSHTGRLVRCTWHRPGLALHT